MKKNNLPKLLLCIISTVGLTLLSCRFSGDIENFYRQMYKPMFAPPYWSYYIIFPLVQIPAAIALFLVIRNRPLKNNPQFTGFCSQLILGLIWQILVFRFDMLILGIFILILWDLLITNTIYTFFKADGNAGCLMIPAFAWALILTYVNVGLIMLNP